MPVKTHRLVPGGLNVALFLRKTTVTERRLDDINDIFAEMKEGQIEGRIVLPQIRQRVK